MVFLFICILLLLSIILFSCSKIIIKITNFKFSSILPKNINEDYKILIRLCVLGKIPILNIKIDKNKLEKINMEEKIERAKNKIIANTDKIDKNTLKIIRKINLEMNDIDLKIKLGTEDATLTSILVPVISTIIAILFRKYSTKNANLNFNVEPLYYNQNLINIAFSGIIQFKMIHIINIIYILSKRNGEGVKKNERTSNRRSYDYSYE